jgi:hypothetical protein
MGLRPEISERPRNILIHKSLPGSFTGTELEQWLRGRSNGGRIAPGDACYSAAAPCKRAAYGRVGEGAGAGWPLRGAVFTSPVSSASPKTLLQPKRTDNVLSGAYPPR